MKKVISNYSGAALEIATRISYSLKVLIISLFIPFVFIFGITYKQSSEKPETKVNFNKADEEISGNTATWTVKDSSYQNS